MFLSRKPLNVLTGLTRRPGRIEIEYTFGTGGKAMIALDRHGVVTDLFPQILRIMSEQGGRQQIGFKIVPRPALGKPFTTGNEVLDTLAGDALQYIEGNCEYPTAQVRVDKRRGEHLLVFPRVYVHLAAVHRSKPQGEFALVTNLVISTKGTVAFGNVAATAV